MIKPISKAAAEAPRVRPDTRPWRRYSRTTSNAAPEKMAITGSNNLRLVKSFGGGGFGFGEALMAGWLKFYFICSGTAWATGGQRWPGGLFSRTYPRGGTFFSQNWLLGDMIAQIPSQIRVSATRVPCLAASSHMTRGSGGAGSSCLDPASPSFFAVAAGGAVLCRLAFLDLFLRCWATFTGWGAR
jgi:hypothetical protein